MKGLFASSSHSLPRTTPPNIVFISLDTLRGDYFTPEHMPETYEWARRNAVIYVNAHAPCTWTLPSHVSYFTGLMPFEHGVLREESAVPGSMELLAEKMKRKGYHTAAFTGGGFLMGVYGLDRGFDKIGRASCRERV